MSTRAPTTLLAVGALLAACSDRMASTAPEVQSPIEPPALARLIGTVDLRAGTMTFEPLGSARVARRDGASAAIYGDQGVTVRIYNTPVVVAPAGAGKKRYSAQVGVRNLLAHRIGDEQSGAAAHNLGIFAFVTDGPTVTGTSSACSPACSATIVGQHGIFNFTTPGQRYWFWAEQLAPAGQAGDTTTFRRTWTFEADTQVTAFQFEVLVSAAWPAPIESRWAIHFGGDSLPDNGTEPSWFRFSNAGSVTTIPNTPQIGMIRINANALSNMIYMRFDSLASDTDAYLETRVRVESAVLLFNPEISFGFDDRTKFVAVGLDSDQAGFLNESLMFPAGASISVATTTFHVYQLRKYAADSVVLYVDGVRRLARSYSLLPATLSGSASFGAYFGPLGTGVSRVSAFGNSSSWDYVIFEIGAVQP